MSGLFVGLRHVDASAVNLVRNRHAAPYEGDGYQNAFARGIAAVLPATYTS